MKLASTLTAVRWFFKVLLDESLVVAILRWDGRGFDDDPGLPNALRSMSAAMSNVLELLNLAQRIRWENTGVGGENEGVHEYLRNLKDAACTADDLLSELDYYRLEQQVEGDRHLVQLTPRVGTKAIRRRRHQCEVWFKDLKDSAMKESPGSSVSHHLLTNDKNKASTGMKTRPPAADDLLGKSDYTDDLLSPRQQREKLAYAARSGYASGWHQSHPHSVLTNVSTVNTAREKLKARSKPAIRRRRRQCVRSGDHLVPTIGKLSHLLLTDDEDQASTSSSPHSFHKDNISNIVPRMYGNVRRLGTITAALSSVLSLLKPLADIQPNPHHSPVASHRITTSFSSSKQTVLGRESERDQIVKLLLLPTPTSVSMIPIVGMGGIGKTTLARMVYNHEEIKKHFNRRIWVCVSDNFEVARLTREILEDLGVEEFDHTTNFSTLQQLLSEKLQSMRYLLVLDDVWDDSEGKKWGSLCAPLQSKKGGSRILMTTRLNTVVSVAAKNMDMLDQCQLRGLPEEKYLSLFNICAFGDENPRDHLSLVKIGKQLARRLKGSPLAAKTVGGLLRENLDEDHWRSVLYNDIWQLPQSHHDIIPVLQLSYQHLAPHLQQCFAYCSIFPKGSQFEKDELVGMWISHGYIRTKSRWNISVEEIGSEYFDNLLSRSFIQAYSHHDYTTIERYFLHNLVHDLAESVSENEYLKINLEETKEITSSVRHVRAHSNSLSILKSCDLRNLRTLIICGSISNDYNVVKVVLNGLKSIRVLSLDDVSVELWWGSIGHLIHLRYLAVNSCYQSMSPDPQFRPYHLQWLVSRTSGPLVLPVATDYLVSLRRLVLGNYGWDQISRMPRIGKVTHLQELRSFRAGKTDGRKLAELKRLNELRGTLSLSSLDNASTKEEALEANLNRKEGIRELVLDCDNGHATPHMAEEVFEGLCPPPYIEELLLHFYLGVESPTWMMMTENSCLSFLQSLTLHSCLKWKVLPPLGQLPVLRHLTIHAAYAVEEIGSSFYGSGVAKSFPRLETLEFKDMPEWVVWSGVKKHADFLFPRLRVLSVSCSRKLKPVPIQCLASVEVLRTDSTVLLAELENLTSLNKLILSNCGEVQSFMPVSASLVTLEITSCSQLQSLTLVSASLVTLEIYSCSQLQSLTLVSASLVTLEIYSCQLQSLFAKETELPSLRKIAILRCDQLVSVELKSFPSLENLRIERCKRIQSVPLLPAMLAELVIEDLWMLTAFSGEQEENLSDLTSLRNIEISFCPRLRSLPLMPASLQRFWIYECPELPRERYREGGDDWHKISRVPYIRFDVLY